MSAFLEIRALGGSHYVRAADVIAVQFTEAQKCILVLTGGATISCAEPAAQVRARVDAALQPTSSEAPHGDGRR